MEKDKVIFEMIDRLEYLVSHSFIFVQSDENGRMDTKYTNLEYKDAIEKAIKCLIGCANKIDELEDRVKEQDILLKHYREKENET